MAITQNRHFEVLSDKCRKGRLAFYLHYPGSLLPVLSLEVMRTGRERDFSLLGLKTDFLLEPLRYDPRFAELVRKVGLPESRVDPSALSGQARFSITALNTNSRLLLENYGGFLPRQGHEYAEQMKEAATQMERLRQDLVGSRSSDGDWKAA